MIKLPRFFKQFFLEIILESLSCLAAMPIAESRLLRILLSAWLPATLIVAELHHIHAWRNPLVGESSLDVCHPSKLLDFSCTHAEHEGGHTLCLVHGLLEGDHHPVDLSEAPANTSEANLTVGYSLCLGHDAHHCVICQFSHNRLHDVQTSGFALSQALRYFRPDDSPPLLTASVSGSINIRGPPMFSSGAG